MKAVLDAMMKRKLDRGEGDEVCASHDIASIFINAFGIDWKSLAKTKNTIEDLQGPFLAPFPSPRAAVFSIRSSVIPLMALRI